MIEGADLRAADAVVPYEIQGVPPRAAPYFMSAFFDDNQDADPAPGAAKPDRGDLVTMDGLGSPKVTLDTPGATTFDLVLSFALPF